MTYHVSLCSPKSPFCKKNAECFTPDISSVNIDYIAGITEATLEDNDMDKENAGDIENVMSVDIENVMSVDIENIMPMNMMDACLNKEEANKHDEELYQLLRSIL